MSVGSPLSALLKSNLRTWISAKGFWLVVAVALLPLVLTGAWVGTHQADVTVSDLRVEGETFAEGQEARFGATVTNSGRGAVGSFNVSLAVGRVQGNSLFVAEDETVTVEGLAPGESRDVTLLWNATPGIVFVVATADPCEPAGSPACEDEIAERDEFNNQEGKPIAISHRVPDASEAPAAPQGLAGDPNATTEMDLVVESLERPTGVRPGDNATYKLTVRNNGLAVENASVTLRVSRAFDGRSVPVLEERENLTFAAGETKTVELTWTAQQGVFWEEGFASAPSGSKDIFPDNNFRSEPFAVDPVVTPDMDLPEAEERLTIKGFYLNVLTLLHLRILLPLVALFYAAGVLADEKERGSLPYLLTRPIPRWLIPLTRFAASFVVAAIATVVGVVLTYLLLFGMTAEGGDIGFLTTPLLWTLITLFVYGGVFTLLGVLVDQRPYLVGILLVLGWEFLAFEFVPWVGNLTVTGHLANMVSGWPLGEGLRWLPEGDAVGALWILLGIGAGSLVLASAQMRRRDFAVG